MQSDYEINATFFIFTSTVPYVNLLSLLESASGKTMRDAQTF